MDEALAIPPAHGSSSMMCSAVDTAGAIVARYRNVRAALVAACRPLSPEDLVVQSMPDASPAKWHLAHTTWFFETFVLSDPAFAGYSPFHPRFGYLFNSYYDAVGDRHPRPRRGLLTRPSAEEIYRYRTYVDQELTARLPQLSDDNLQRVLPVIELGLHHEQQHLELLFTDIKHAFAQNPLRPAYRESNSDVAASNDLAPQQWRSFEAGVRRLGHAGNGFAFDNETPAHRVFLESFALSNRLVTCGEFRQFMAEDGYNRPEFWLSDGWAARRANSWDSPGYWEKDGDRWVVFTLNGLRPVSDPEPVCHVSFYEADAFARWSGSRLPTEAEWEIAAADLPLAGNLLENDWLHPIPQSVGDRFAQMYGDVWEWTQSPYVPYPGYRPLSGALGEYNGKFMCNQMVLRGGSCVTATSHIRPTYRNFFPPEVRWQFTGFRLARSL